VGKGKPRDGGNWGQISKKEKGVFPSDEGHTLASGDCEEAAASGLVGKVSAGGIRRRVGGGPNKIGNLEELALTAN